MPLLSPSSVPIAIIGMSCKFAGDADSPSKLWDLLAAGKDGWSTIPEDRFDPESLYHPDQRRTDRHHLQGGHFISGDMMVFDAPFFSQSAESASSMDPQLRLTLEGAYEAIENAGIPIEKLAGSNTSVFSGTFGRDYTDRLVKDPESLPASYFTGNGAAMYSNRISHFFDLRGPSLTADTGCSGSMAALHLGAQTIRSGESDMSIIAVAQFMQNPDLVIALSNLGVLGPEGRCYSFDHRANGYGRGEGMAVVVLKRLSSAIADGDHVHAVIRETHMNQDGKTSTITSPSMDAQQRLIEECYQRAGLELSNTAYVEAHMTGTPTGDPIEAEVLSKTFGKSRATGDPVYIGSIKPNIGHTEPVSGLASIIKTALVLQKGLIPPHINYEKPNPAIPLDEWNLRLPLQLTAWPKGRPMRTSVNNFGYGGTNVHVIMESLAETLASKAITWSKNKVNACNQQKDQLPSYVYVISAKHSSGALDMNKNLAAYIRKSISQGRDISPRDLAHTLSDRRSQFQWITSVRATSLDELATHLDEPHRKPFRASGGRVPRIGFVFNGQGAQWVGMGLELVKTYPIFKDSIRKADRILREKYGAPWSLYEELFLRSETATRIHDAEISQPASVSVQLGLVDLLRSWNINPSAVVSHSSGEIPAAFAAGVLTFEEALGVVYHRGRLASKVLVGASSLPKGGMMAARLSSADAREYLKDLSSDGKAVVACVNSPSSITFSGDEEVLEELAELLEDDAVTARKLKVPLAYHSHHMQKMAQQYQEALGEVIPTESMNCRKLHTLFSSPVTGSIVSSANAIMDPKHWVDNLTNPVLFSQALEEMVFSIDDAKKANPASPPTRATNVDILLEVGAHSTLSGAIRETLGSAQLLYSTCLKQLTNAVTTMQDMAAELVSRGYPVSLREVNRTTGCAYVLHDLPSYSWDHNTRYLVEPRTSRENRYRRFATHELLGSPVPGSNALTPTWRNFLRLQDLPWLEDHQLDGRIVLPGAAYITLAIEAVRKLKRAKKEEPTAYRIRDVAIMNALIIPTNSRGAEIIFTLSECSERELDHRDWFEFELCSVGADDSWIRHCTGFVLAETTASAKKLSGPNHNVKMEPALDAFLTLSGSRSHEVNPEDTFANMRKMGIHHGPSFQNLIRSHVSNSREKSVTTFSLASYAVEQIEEYIIHPTTLDSIFQTCYFSLPPTARKGGMPVPRSVENMYIPSNMGRHASHRMNSYVELLNTNRRGATFSGDVFPDIEHMDGDQTEPATPFEMRGMHLQRIQAEDDESLSNKTPRVHSQTRWEMDVMHKLPDAVLGSVQILLSDAELAHEKSMIEAAYYLMCNALEELEKDGPAESQVGKPYLHKYLKWVFDSVASVEQNTLPYASALGSSAWPSKSPQARAALLQSLESGGGAGGQMLCRIGKRIPAVVRGELHPLELMTEGGLLQRYYAEVPQFENSYRQLRGVIELYAIKQPGARILEIGAGTGGATAHVLEAFAARGDRQGNDHDDWPTLLGHYDYTDISADFFVAARDKFAVWKDKMSFFKMDIEKDPLEQGLVAGSYDLIVASQVLHATKSLAHTLSNARRLLKPGGKLVMLEGTKHGIGFEIIWGTLPGWWLSEDPERQQKGALADEDTWNQYLTSNGFSGIDINVLNCKQKEVQISNVIVTTALPFKTPSYSSNLAIIYDGQDETTRPWLEELATALADMTRGRKPIFETMDIVEPKADTVYIITNELTQPLVATMTEPIFEKVRRILVDGQGIFWLSQGGYIDSARPLWHETQGLLRTFRREDQNKRCVSLDFDGEPWVGDYASSSIQHILRVFSETFRNDIGTVDTYMDWEYAVKDSILHVPRIFPDVALDRACSGAKPNPQLESWQNVSCRDRDLVYQIPNGAPGSLPDQITFAEVAPMAADPVPAGMVEIETKAFGLNFRDLMLAMGLVDDFVFPTHEAAGIVTRLGPTTAIKSGLKVGDRVCGAFRGDFSSTSRGWWENITKMPEGMSFDEGAAFPIAYLTAHVGLFHVAHLEAGERVLIHSAAGAVGQAAIMLAKYAQAEIFVTCGTEAKRTFLKERYGIPNDHIFSSRDASFVEGIKRQTSGQGVDVVLNSLAGPLLKSTWECMAQFGRFVEIGKVDLHASRKLDMAPLGHNVTISGLDLVQYSEHGPRGRHVIKKALADLVKMYNSGCIKSVSPVSAHSISEMGAAFKFMQTGTHMGKLVVTVGQPGDVLSIIPRAPPMNLHLMDNITHLVVGGLTGVAYALTLWMIENGAKNVLAVSRNAVNHPNGALLKKTAQEHDCRLIIRNCDIADEKAVLDVLAEVKAAGMPRVGGVLQAAMVLDDTIMERMTFEQWQTAIRPKVDGTLHIHNNLPDLTYFIMLSSGSAITGNVSQANYAAGNTFQDALARHRTAHGQPAVSINLGPVEGAGYVFERGEEILKQVQDAVTSIMLSVEHVSRLIEGAIAVPLRSNPDESQIITSFPRWEILPANQVVKEDKRFGTLRLGDVKGTGVAKASAKGTSANRVDELRLELETKGKSTPAPKVVELVTALLAAEIGDLFSVDPADVDVSQPLTHHGVDSLVAVRFRNWLSGDVKAKTTVFEILQAPSLTDFASLVASRSALVSSVG